MKCTFRNALVAAVFVAGSSVTANAQSFSQLSGVALGNSTAEVAPATRVFWNNSSYDGSNCNVGYILTGGASSACANQVPSPWLPFTGTNADMRYLSNGVSSVEWMFQGGTYQIEMLGGGSSGSVQGLSSLFGYFGGGYGDVVLPASATAPWSTQISFSSNWGLFIDLVASTAGTRIRSNGSGRNFALFSVGDAGMNDGAVVPNTPQVFYVGMEDQDCLGQSEGNPGCQKSTDWDNQDIVLKITAVPEPGTYALMAAGLFGFAIVGYRRRQA